MFTDRTGDAEHDEELNHRISPLFHIDNIRAPLLIGQGANDPRYKPVGGLDANRPKFSPALGLSTISAAADTLAHGKQHHSRCIGASK